VGLTVAGELEVVDRDHIRARRLAGGNGPQQLLIADVGAILQPDPAGFEGCDGDAESELGRSIG